MPVGTGILFDMGVDQNYIQVNMQDMLFSLDIAFINSTGGVVGILRDVEPGDNAVFDAGSGLGARYFLEVNADEMVDVNVSDDVSISGVENGVQPTFWAGLLASIPALIMVMTAGAEAYKDIKGDK